MKYQVLLFSILGLASYSLVMLIAEFMTSQEEVRPYFTDISGPVRFYAINTSLSVFLLWGTALLFLVTLSFRKADTCIREILFLLSQVCVFGYLGMDDRFLLHEQIGQRLQIGDHYVLLVVGFAEALCLWFLGRKYLMSLHTFVPLFLAAAFFGLMTIVDGFFPHEMVMRLSIEDLLKVWAGFCFLIFSWSVLHQFVSEQSETA